MRSLAAFPCLLFVHRLTFTDAKPAVLEYAAAGRQDSLTLVRQGF